MLTIFLQGFVYASLRHKLEPIKGGWGIFQELISLQHIGCSEYLPFEIPAGRTLISCQIALGLHKLLMVGLLLWRLEVMRIELLIIYYCPPFSRNT